MLIFLIYAYVVILTAVTYYKYGVVSSIIHMCTCSLTWLNPIIGWKKYHGLTADGYCVTFFWFLNFNFGWGYAQTSLGS